MCRSLHSQPVRSTADAAEVFWRELPLDQRLNFELGDSLTIFSFNLA
jgi:hypothetical protein